MEKDKSIKYKVVKSKWEGHPLNNSDIGYDDDWENSIIELSTTGPHNPIDVDINEKDTK